MPLPNLLVKETTEQRALIEWLTFKHIGHFSVPNGFIAGGRNKWAMLAKLKKEGLLKGAPDLILIDRSPKTGQPVAVEMKRVKGGDLSPDQRQVIASMRAAGWIVILAPGAHSAIMQLEREGF